MNKKEQKVGDPLCWLVQEVILKWVTPNFGRSRKEAAIIWVLLEKDRGVWLVTVIMVKSKRERYRTVYMSHLLLLSRGSCLPPSVAPAVVALPCEPTNSSFTHKPQNHRRSLNSLLPSVIYCSSLWKYVAHPTSMTFVLYTSCIIFFNGQVWS